VDEEPTLDTILNRIRKKLTLLKEINDDAEGELLPISLGSVDRRDFRR